jgi:DNA-binding CsgD family transcriptional regulator
MHALEQQQEGLGLQRHEIARARRPVGTLMHATDGALERSRRWTECIGPLGLRDLATTACRDRHGCWGWLDAYRSADGRPFDDEDVELLDRVAPALGDALRRRAIKPNLPARRRPPGVLILDKDPKKTSWTAIAREWIRELPTPVNQSTGLLPPVVYAVAGRADPEAEPSAARLGARSRVRTIDGSWAIVEGARLDDALPGKIAITIRAQTPAESLDLLCRVHGLTRRERQLAALVVEGLATAEIATQLVISNYTVKDHLKSIFEKTGVRGRRGLMTTVVGDPVNV